MIDVWLMIYWWFIDDWIIIDWWLMIYWLLVNFYLINYLWLTDDWFRIYWWLIDDWFMIDLWMINDWLINDWWLIYWYLIDRRYCDRSYDTLDERKIIKQYIEELIFLRFKNSYFLRKIKKSGKKSRKKFNKKYLCNSNINYFWISCFSWSFDMESHYYTDWIWSNRCRDLCPQRPGHVALLHEAVHGQVLHALLHGAAQANLQQSLTQTLLVIVTFTKASPSTWTFSWIEPSHMLTWSPTSSPLALTSSNCWD